MCVRSICLKQYNHFVTTCAALSSLLGLKFAYITTKASSQFNFLNNTDGQF